MVDRLLTTTRSVRKRLDFDRPVEDQVLFDCIDLAEQAPSGGNVQPARFLVIRDRDLITEFGSLYHEAWWAKRKDEFGWEPDQPIPEDSPYRMAGLLASEIQAAPVIVLAFTRPDAPAAASSVLPGVQNLMLAARSLGIGSVLTTLHSTVMDRVNAMFDVPDGAEFHCCVPLGYPRGNFGLTNHASGGAGEALWSSAGGAKESVNSVESSRVMMGIALWTVMGGHSVGSLPNTLSHSIPFLRDYSISNSFLLFFF